ncbi:MAG: nucleotide exchange factor GrpE [Deltaproteobacteria bacterium RBG_13_43_22]|nr:MAG: nucleotide exchange factor GrpE [Deltaproteobacteria bacterium RBG_13_43_22]
MTKIKVTEEPSQTKSSDLVEENKEGSEKEKKPDLETQLQEKEKESKDNYDRFLRLSAELENFKKRAEKEKSETYKFANENILKDLLPVLDNLERALEHGRETGNLKALLEGVELTHKALWAVMEKYGITRIEAMGEDFDPNHHEAVMVQEDAQKPPGQVISQLQIGYRLHNRLVRPAMVVVSKKPELNPDEDPEA